MKIITFTAEMNMIMYQYTDVPMTGNPADVVDRGKEVSATGVHRYMSTSVSFFKYLLRLLIILCVCSSCRQELSPEVLRICNELKEYAKSPQANKQRIDSLLRLSGKFSPEEQLLIHFSSPNTRAGNITKDIRELLANPNPRPINKELAFTLLEHTVINNPNIRPHTQEYINYLSSVLFNMENREKLSPEERCRFLTLKSRIYSQSFKEYTPALQFASEAESIARKHGFAGKCMDRIYTAEFQAYLYMDSTSKIIDITHHFLNNDEKEWLTPGLRNQTYTTLCKFYLAKKEYKQALYWHQQYQDPNKDAPCYNGIPTEIYLGLDSIPQALSYLKARRQIVTKLPELTRMAWDEARIRLKTDDRKAYEACLKEVSRLIRQSDIERYSPQLAAAGEACAELLWQQGKRSEAIKHMTDIANTIIRNKKDFTYTVPGNYKASKRKLDHILLLIDYCLRDNRPAEVLRWTQVYDTLQQLHRATGKKLKQEKLTSRIYAADLCRNLELRSAGLERQQQKLYMICLLLIISLGLMTVFGLMYRKRQKELNRLYARQKEFEPLEQTTIGIADTNLQNLSAEEQLFRKLEKQLHQDKLFLDPDFSLENLCRLAGSNRMYISTSINKYAGMNINRWINKARINHSTRLIGEGETNLQVLAEASGFSSTTSFFRNFKQFTLLSPKQYIDREKRHVTIKNKVY